MFTDECPYVRNTDTNGRKAVDTFWKPIEEHHGQFVQCAKDANYEDVEFNWDNGGVKATHKDHNFDKNTGIYEKKVQKIGFDNGNSVVLTSEHGKEIGENYVDGIWNGMSFEIGTSIGTGKNNIKKILNHCREKEANIAVIYFPEKSNYSNNRIYKGISKFNGQTDYRFSLILCIVEDSIIAYK